MSRRRNSAAAFISGLAGGMALGQKWKESSERSALRKDLADVSNVRETAVASGDEAQKAGMDAYNMALSAAATPEDRARVEQDYAPTLKALEAEMARPASVIQTFGTGRNFQQVADKAGLSDAQAVARAGIYAAHGREDDATRTLQNQSRRREIADQQELRAALNPQSNLLAGTTTDMADVVGGMQPQSAAGRPDVVAKTGIPTARDPLDHYLREVAPKAVQTLVKQGRVAEAKQYADFLESREGLGYARAYTNGLKRFAVGDYEGAMGHFEKLYNDDLYPDGRRVKMTPSGEDGLRIDQLDAEGNVIASKEGKLADLAEQAALMLNPLQAVKFIADQNAKRQGEAATLDRQIQLETMRQHGRETAEDRRDARLDKQLAATDARLGRQLSAMDARLGKQLEARERGGGLTLTQQRSNMEIDAAREMIDGLSDDDIRKRTTPTLLSGRENPDYDMALARAAKLASRRKVGEDEWFDERQGRQPAAAAKPAGTPKERAMAALAANPETAGFTLGDQTAQGFKVLDKSGKLVGYLKPETKR